MNSTSNTQTLDHYFQTGNEFHDQFYFEMYQEVLKEELFDDPKTPIQFCLEQVAQLTANASNPIQALEGFKQVIEQGEFSDKQAVFLYDQVQSYLECGDSSEETDQVCTLLNINMKKTKARYTPSGMIEKAEVVGPLTNDLRNRLKLILQQEIEKVPELLEGMEGKERLETLIKLMPFVLPKVETVSITHGEPFKFGL